MNNKTLVTGGTGLVGSHLIYHLLMNGVTVKALKRPESNTDIVQQVFSFYNSDKKECVKLFQSIEWVHGDLTDYFSISDMLEDVSFVYHAAAFVSFNPRKKKEVFKINVEGTANLVNACLEKKISKFCHFSSIGALGNTTNNQSINEETTWQVNKERSNYSKSKFNAELEVWRASKEGMPVIIVNPGVIFGPGSINRSTGALFKQGKNGYRIYPSGSNAFVDVRDVVNASVKLMESDITDSRFIIAGDNIPFKKILHIIALSMSVATPKYKAPRWLANIAWRLELLKSYITSKEPLLTKESVRASFSHSTYSSDKLIKQLDFKFIPIEQSIKDTWNWYKNLN